MLPAARRRAARAAAADQAISALRERYAAGEQTAWTATGGQPTSGVRGRADDAAAAAEVTGPCLGRAVAPEERGACSRARRVRDGEGGGAGMRPKLGGEEE